VITGHSLVAKNWLMKAVTAREPFAFPPAVFDEALHFELLRSGRARV
jgi:hypothetical protein